MNETFYEIIKSICHELDIQYNLLSNGWVIALTKNGITKILSGYKFDLNSHALGLVIDDKFALYGLLKCLNINIIEHNIVYGESNNNSYALGYNNMEYLTKLFDKYKKNVVLKVNNGTCGINVEHIENIKELEEKFLKMGHKNNSLSLCPYYEIDREFRSIILGNEIRLIYGKERPIVIGDGKSTIKELLDEFNPCYFKSVVDEKLDVVLKKGEQYSYDWKFNLSRGARLVENVSETDKKNIIKIVTSISEKLDLGFCSVDVIKTKGKYYVLEINSGVMMKNYMEQANNGYEIAYNIYKDAIIKMFEDNE